MAEAVLWNELKDRRLDGFKFLRQMPIGPYIADFVCRSRKLVIEVDGSQHAIPGRDDVRDRFIRSNGFWILRFWNVDVLKQTASVCDTILAALHGRLEETSAFDLRYMAPISKARDVAQ